MEHRSRSSWMRWLKRGAACAVAVALLALLGWYISFARAKTNQIACSSQLCAVNLALYQYHDEHGCFPPAFIRGTDGKRMHSWRILIMKYLDRPTYDAYDFQEPWDGLHNRRLLGTSAAHFLRCPVGSPDDSTYTDYVAVVGSRTAFPGAATTTLIPLARYDGKPGSRDMILIVEIANSDIKWTEPRDLDFETMSFRINDPDKPSISSRHPGGANVVLRQSASGIFARENINPKLIKTLLTLDDPEQDLDGSLWLPNR